MDAPSFEKLCTDFCALVGLPAPRLNADEDGSLAFHFVWRGVGVNALYAPALSVQVVHVLFDLGPIEGRGIDERALLRRLLDANFLAFRLYPPVFARHPVSGDAVLQCLHLLGREPPSALLALVEQGVVLALQWRDDFFMPTASTVASLDERMKAV